MESILELFWNLNVSSNIKYMIIIGIIILILTFCIYGGRKKPKTINGKEFYLNDKLYLQYKKIKNPSLCQQNYIKCMELNATNIEDQCIPTPCIKKLKLKLKSKLKK